jgi:hypothetical protein
LNDADSARARRVFRRRMHGAVIRVCTAFAAPPILGILKKFKTNNKFNRECVMSRSFAASILLLLGLAFAAAPAVAAGSSDSAAPASASTFSKYAWLWSDKSADKGAATSQQRATPVAACAMDCCCQMVVGGSTKNECKSRDDCINAGGICHNKSDARCN